MRKKFEIFSEKDWKICKKRAILYLISGIMCTVIGPTGSVIAADKFENKQLAKAELGESGTENIHNPAKGGRRNSLKSGSNLENVRKVTSLTDFEKENQRLRLENEHLWDQLAVMRDRLKRMEKAVKSKDSEDEALINEVSMIEAELMQLRKALDAERKKQKKAEISRKETAEQNIFVLRKELIDTLGKSTVDLKRLKQLEMSVASILDTMNPVYIGNREMELAETLELTLTAGKKLSGKSALAADKMLNLLDQMKMDEIEKAKLRVQLEELRALAVGFARLDQDPGKAKGFDNCRVLEINEGLQLVILSAGYRNGVRVNLTLYADNGRKTPLRIVAVRPFVSAAIPETGKIGDLIPGMKVRASR